MIWVLTIPAIIYFTFSNLLDWCFPDLSCHYHNSRGFLGWCFLIFVGCFISGLISLVPLGIGLFIGSLPKRRGYFYREYELVVLREREGSSGKFFLGSGAINSQQYYFWYRKSDDGSITGGKTVREPGVRIYEDNTKPRMVEYKTNYVEDWARKYIWIFGLDGHTIEWCPDFHIPKGSIKEGYSL